MKLLIRLVFAVALLGASYATPVSAQYMFLDTNGDGLHTDADDLAANGTPTVATLYVITNQNRDGTGATCDQDPLTPLSINSYVVNLQAVGGLVEYSNFTNLQTTMTVNFGEVDADSINYKNGYGQQAALDPGKYALATITITGLSGSPEIQIVDQVPGSPDFTSFGTLCPGAEFDNTYKLTGPAGGSDWQDADGLGPGPGGNAFPTLVVPDEVVGGVGSLLSVTATATDENLTDVLTITQTSTAPFLTQFTHTPSVSPATATLSGTPPDLSQGNYTINWSVSDGVNPPVTATTNVMVTEGGGPNECPVLTPIGNQTVNELETLQLTIAATETDPGQTVEFSLGAGAPEGATLNSSSGIFTWIPTEEQGPGTYDIVFRVTDNGSPACTDSEVVVVTVQEVGGENQCPVLGPIGDRTVNEGVPLTFTATATDSDVGQTLTFSLSTNAPAGATLDPSTGLFNWTPSEEQSPGVVPITIRVFDTGQPACADSETFNVTVNEVGDNACPVLATIGNKSVDELSTLTFTATATDADVGQTITYTLDPGFPAGASIDLNTGVFTFTPTEAQGPGLFQVTVRATDSADPACSVFEIIQITVNEVAGGNECPVLATIGNQTVNELSLLTFTVTATDPDVGQTLAFTLEPGFPDGAGINSSSGVFNFTPTEAQGPGTYPVTVTVTDNGDPVCSDSETIQITVNEVDGENQCPVLDPIGNRTVDELALLTFDANATDPDAGQTLTFSLDPGFPAGAVIDPGTGVFTFTPTEDQGPGTHSVTVRVTDSFAGTPCSDFETLTITVNEVDGENQCPVLTPIGNRTVNELSLLTFTAMATDPDAGQTLTFSLDAGFPTGASINSSTGVFTFTPTEGQGPGTYTVTVRVSDDADPACEDFETITITVNEVDGENECPVLNGIANRTVDVGELLSLDADATDPDAGQTLTFSLDPGFPTGASIDPSTGEFTFTPIQAQVGEHTVVVRVTDNGDPACSDTEEFRITVNPLDGENECPVIDPIKGRTVEEGETLTFTVSADDPENTTLVYALGPGAPSGAQIHPLTGVFMWTPTSAQAGTYTITIQVRDTCEDPCTVTTTVQIVVEDSKPQNECPVLNGIANRTVEEGELLSLDADATDPDKGQTLTFTLDPGFPAGASIDPVTGAFTFTPTHAQIGDHEVVVRVTDNGDPACSDTEEFRITVEEGENECPVLSNLADRTVNEGELLTFTATATDPEDDEIIFSLDAGAPAGATIHPNTGVFTWTPTSAQGAETYEITIRATDLCDSPCSDTETIEVTVLDVGGENECPVLDSIGDRTVTEGNLLTFTATANDPEDEEIVFSLDAGAPAGAVIHASTGVFTWTPSSNQGPAKYEITIRATDLCDTPCSDTETIEVTVLDGNGAGGSSTVIATFEDSDRTTKLWTGKPTTCVQLEVVGDDEIDYSTIELVYNGQRLAAREGSSSRDKDRDGNSEGTVCFSKQDLRTLFAGLPSGEHTVSFQIVGRFESGESFTADVTHRVAVRGNGNKDDEEYDGVAGNGRKKARVSPNPINPSAVLSFGTTREGAVKIHLYDLAGRLVRTLYDGSMPAGANSVAWDGNGDNGSRVSSGVYYFRVLSPDGQDVVRVTVLK
ncbi:MAG TPA: putative Ig domain-containing protein [Candidatus Eisenbacteria bacterium]|nr:putative Ig domain-containing protein [Candidatus Eisenbacteria bacterium]